MASARVLDAFRSRRMAILFGLGFSSGLPLYLTGQTLQAWMSKAGVDLGQIAAFSLVGLAYTLKFTWTPLLDRWSLPWLGRRRGWVLVAQLGLGVAIAAMGVIDPVTSPAAMAIAAAIVAFLSASQDVVLDAYNADLLAPDERAVGAGVYVMGYRVAMLVTGTFALILADHAPWRLVYGLCGAAVVACALVTVRAEEPPPRAPPRSLRAALTMPFSDFVQRHGARGAAAALAFAALYKFGDGFAQALTVAFYTRGLHFTLSEYATVNKVALFVGTVLGAAAGGGLVVRHGVGRMLVVFGLLQAATNLLYVWLAASGKSYVIFGAAVGVDSFANAMGTGAFVTYLMSLVSPEVSATQFALLTSLSSVGQRVFGWLAADVERAVGWGGFFVVTALLALPGVAMAAALARRTRGGDRVAPCEP